MPPAYIRTIRVCIILAFTMVSLIELQSCRNRPHAAPAVSNATPAPPPPFDPKGFFLPEQQIRFASYSLLDFELVMGYSYEDRQGVDTVKVLFQPYAICDVSDSLSPSRNHGITLYSDSAIIREDTLLLLFHHDKIGKIEIAGRFLTTSTSFWYAEKEGRIAIEPLITVTKNGRTAIKHRSAFRYTGGIDRIEPD
jgi:hypothetical protein